MRYEVEGWRAGPGVWFPATVAGRRILDFAIAAGDRRWPTASFAALLKLCTSSETKCQSCFDHVAPPMSNTDRQQIAFDLAVDAVLGYVPDVMYHFFLYAP